MAQKKEAIPIKCQQAIFWDAGRHRDAYRERVQFVIARMHDENVGTNSFKVSGRRRINCCALVVDPAKASRCWEKRVDKTADEKRLII